jgi:hypothetical protein
MPQYLANPIGPEVKSCEIPHLAKNARYPDFLYAVPASVACAAFIKESRRK